MTMQIVLTPRGDDKLSAIRSGGGVKIEDTEDAITTLDCCCNCAEFPNCLHCFDESTYTSTTNGIAWPVGVNAATVICIGCGGAGGASNGTQEAGGGGGGGACAWAVVLKDASTVDVTVNDAADGFASRFKQNGTTECLAVAGNDGAAGPNGLGGAGGLAASCIGDVAYGGGRGANGVDDSHGGGGGGGAGVYEEGANGNLADGGNGGSQYGGKGGGAGQAGENYGGGGGGGFNQPAGGAGAGVVKIRWWQPAEMLLNIAGAPGGDSECDCADSANPVKSEVMWDNLNSGSFLLLGIGNGDVFTWTAENGGAPVVCSQPGCTLEGSNAVLVEKTAERACVDGVMIPHKEAELYVTSIIVIVACQNDQMHLQSITFGACGRNREWTSGVGWSAWTCFTPPPANIPAVCMPVGTIEYAASCDMGGSMTTEIFWPLLTFDEFCVPAFDCAFRTSGSMTGNIGC